MMETNHIELTRELTLKLIESFKEGNPDHNEWWEDVLKIARKNGLTEKQVIWTANYVVFMHLGIKNKNSKRGKI